MLSNKTKQLSTFGPQRQGQSLVEYVLLLLVISGLGALLGRFSPRIFRSVETPIRRDFVLAYKYGDPKACGEDGDPNPPCNGTPSRHPSLPGGGNFKMFGRK